MADGREAALLYRKWLVRSDASRDPQAFIIAPDSAVAIAQAIVRAPDAYGAGRAAACTALDLMREALRQGTLCIAPRELPWLDRMQKSLETLPDTESAFIMEMLGELDLSRFVPGDYEIG